jgi:RNA polymerase sigma-70 factor (ECF subfamily)
VEIWEEIAADREAGARRLVAELGDRLFRCALALSKDSHAAEDLVFRTFERVIAKIGRFNAEMSFWNWVYAVMYNLYRSDLRKSRAEVLEDPEAIEDIASNGGVGDFAERLSETDTALLRRCVESLAPDFRAVIALRYFEDKTLDEMSQIMRIPAGTLKWRLHKARRRLAVMLEKAFGTKKGDKS